MSTPRDRRGQTLLALGFMLAMLLVACNSAPRTVDTPPAFPGATELEEGENAMADLMATTLREFTTVEADIDITTYALPEDGTWEAVRTHYADAFAGSDWSVNESLAMEYDNFRSHGWRRGAPGQGEVFVISYVLDPEDQSPLLTVGHFSE